MNLGRYLELKEIGDCELGTVYRALDSLLDQVVSVIAVSHSIVQERQTRERFLREAQNWAGVSSHPNVVSLLDLSQQDAAIFLVLEEIPLLTLEDQLNEKRANLKLARVKRTFNQICLAVDHIHRQDVLCRRISTDTILIKNDASAAVLGVGVAFLAWRGYEMLDLGRLYRFYSPEQARGEIATIQTEVYSLGAVLYRMVTGLPPFGAEHYTILVEQILHVQPIPPGQLNSQLPDQLNGIILKCLAKAPEERYQSVPELMAAIESVD